jgi:hypothetical protein
LNAATLRVEPLRIELEGASTLRLNGAMTFATAARALPEGLRRLEGLAVVVEWLAWGRRNGRRIELRAVPRSLIEIARISELEELLEPQV